MNGPASLLVVLLLAPSPGAAAGAPGRAEWLAVPAGLAVREIARVPDARGLRFAPNGELYVNSMDDDGRLVALKRERDGSWSSRTVVTGLDSAHSLEFWKGDLWVAETHRVIRFKGWRGPFRREEARVVVPSLPRGGHSTRTLLPLDDDSFLVSVGSSCNVCLETQWPRAAIAKYRVDGSGATLYADGLRNAVGLIRHPITKQIWATCNGRDWLGDELPPECLYLVEPGKHYGWPFTWADGQRDREFGRDGFVQTGMPAAMLPAHCAPLGLAAYDGTLLPAEYRGDLFVALHGSWNRATNFPPQIVRLSMKHWTPGKKAEFADEKFQGPFATGFLTGFQKHDGNRLGRPADVTVGPDGALYVSDDARGSVYRIAPEGK